MLLRVAMLFIFLYQSFEYQAFVFGSRPLASCRLLALNPKLQPMLSAILMVIIFLLVFGQTFFDWLYVIWLFLNKLVSTYCDPNALE